MKTTFTDLLNNQYALGVIVLVLFFTSSCTEQPTLPVAEESFSSDVVPVSYGLNFFSLTPKDTSLVRGEKSFTKLFQMVTKLNLFTAFQIR